MIIDYYNILQSLLDKLTITGKLTDKESKHMDKLREWLENDVNIKKQNKQTQQKTNIN